MIGFRKLIATVALAIGAVAASGVAHAAPTPKNAKVTSGGMDCFYHVFNGKTYKICIPAR